MVSELEVPVCAEAGNSLVSRGTAYRAFYSGLKRPQSAVPYTLVRMAGDVYDAGGP